MLGANFATRPGDVVEQRRRGELIRYADTLPSYSVLSSFQQAPGNRVSIAVAEWEVWGTATR